MKPVPPPPTDPRRPLKVAGARRVSPKEQPVMSHRPSVSIPSGTRSLALALAAAVGLTCGGRPNVAAPTQDLGIVAGTVIKGRVNGATVHVFRLAGGQRGAEVGTGTTAEDGTFRIGVGTTEGSLLVVASGGAFADEATVATVNLNSDELTALVPAFSSETTLEGLLVTPVSHLAAGLALHYVNAEGQAVPAAAEEAWQHLNLHFGGLDWRTTTPADLTASPGAALDEAGKAGLVLAALSMQARSVSENAGLTPGGRVNGLTLTEALYADLSFDGFFDGVGPQGAVVLPSGGTVSATAPTAYRLNGQTARVALGQAIARFLQSDRNGSAVKTSDAQQLIKQVSTNSDARIFRDAGRLADNDPPVITFLGPIDGSGANGQVPVQVKAQDTSKVKSFNFTAPAQLVGLVPTLEADGKTAVLSGTLDVSALPDGPLQLVVVSADEFQNASTKAITITVSNSGPTITVNGPADGATVKGTALITASATPKVGAIAKLTLTAAPAGVGPDQLPAADSFAASWDTTRATEGDVQLIFHAEDTFGTATDLTITVNVDNVPFGAVTAWLSVGAPLPGATVKLLAIDEATGQPATDRPGGAARQRRSDVGRRHRCLRAVPGELERPRAIRRLGPNPYLRGPERRSDAGVCPLDLRIHQLHSPLPDRRPAECPCHPLDHPRRRRGQGLRPGQESVLEHAEVPLGRHGRY